MNETIQSTKILTPFPEAEKAAVDTALAARSSFWTMIPPGFKPCPEFMFTQTGAGRALHRDFWRTIPCSLC